MCTRQEIPFEIVLSAVIVELPGSSPLSPSVRILAVGSANVGPHNKVIIAIPKMESMVKGKSANTEDDVYDSAAAESQLRNRKLSVHSLASVDQGCLNDALSRKSAQRLSKEEEQFIEKTTLVQQMILNKMKIKAQARIFVINSLIRIVLRIVTSFITSFTFIFIRKFKVQC